jgi:hypothetical protein
LNTSAKASSIINDDPNRYKVEAEIQYAVGGATPAVLKQITSLGGYNIPFGSTQLVDGATYTAPTPSYVGAFFNNSATPNDYTYVNGLVSGTTFKYGTPFNIRLILAPETGYTFKATDGDKSYFEVDDPADATGAMTKEQKKAYIEDYLAFNIYDNTVVPETGRVKLTDIYINSSNRLVLDVSYTVKPTTILHPDLTLAELGDVLTAPGSTVPFPPVFSASPSTKFTTAIAWKKVVSGADVDVTETAFAASTTYKAILTITPKNGYTFVGVHDGTAFSDIDTTIRDNTRYGNGGSAKLKTTAINVKSFIIESTGETSETIKAKDKLTVTLTFAL